MFGLLKGMLSDIGVGTNHWEKIMLRSRHVQARSQFCYQIYPADGFKLVFNDIVELTNAIADMDWLTEEQAKPYYGLLLEVERQQYSLESTFNLRTDVESEFARRSQGY
ncbi:TPA: hypothetical protein I7737_21360 [Vibrio vulnificus]|nr:hypothetical protein [Vibrio vulnificus]